MKVQHKIASLAGLSMLLLASTAAAGGSEPAECAADSDCQKGFVCEVVGGSDCAVAACIDGEECPEPEPCAAEEILGCVPGPCESDADCGENQVCFMDSYESCADDVATDAACSSDGECPARAAPEPAECTTETFSQCIPRWAAPCEAAADCGPGFTCEEAESCSCSGSAGATPACAPGEECPEPEPAPEPECSCEATGEFYCKLIETSCAASSDCEAGLVCVENGSRPVCGGTDSGGGSDPAPSSGGSGGASGSAGTPDGGAEEKAQPVDPDCGQSLEAPEMLCVPADYELWGASGGDFAEGSNALGVAGTGRDDSGKGGAPPALDADGESDTGSDTAKDESGCSVRSGRAAAGQGLWLLAACAMLVRRRRRVGA